MQVQVIWMLILAKNTLWNNPLGGSWGEMHLHWLKHSRPCLFPPTADWAGFSPRTLCFQWVLIIASFTESTQEQAEVIKGSANSQ